MSWKAGFLGFFCEVIKPQTLKKIKFFTLFGSNPYSILISQAFHLRAVLVLLFAGRLTRNPI